MCLGHSCGHPQGGALQNMDVYGDTTEVCEPLHRRKMQCFNIIKI